MVLRILPAAVVGFCTPGGLRSPTARLRGTRSRTPTAARCTIPENTNTHTDDNTKHNTGRVDVTNSTFIANTTDSSGGGLFNAGIANVTQCKFAGGNTAEFGGA